ncbi:hypothetical protein STEG23_011127 [Scotinomys teguina]
MEPRRAASGSPSQGSAVGAGSAAELVYHLAGALGTELQELARRFGPDAAAGLVPLVVRALELLEKAAVGTAPDSLQVSAQQAELELRRLREENQRLRRELGSGPQEERKLLRQLKEVTDRQRDELRAHSRDLMRRSQETEALQEQLQRLLLVNSELRQKLAVVQTQLRAAQEREREHQVARDGSRQLAEEQRLKPEAATPDDRVEEAQPQPGHPPETAQCGFSREELEQILQERNELKANVFLLKEELAYFQRELLTDHRVPGLLLEAMKVAVKKQRKKIKAKMLGTPEEAGSSDDEDDSWLLLSNDKDEAPLVPGSRIQNLTLATAAVCRAGGALSVAAGASVCEASAVLLLATAPALPVSTEPAVSCPATMATMEHSAEKGRHGKNALIAGILVPLLLLILGIIGCAYCCSATRLDPKDRPERNGAALFRMKQQVWGALTSLGSTLSCGSLSNYKLPWVTVSHHDPEVPFNHSFIEPPSAGWASDDSFSSDPDSGEEDEDNAYSVPPREEVVSVAHEESPAPSLPGGPFPPPEDASTPFPIPRTSSLAQAKRPSVSFAEGTKFAPQNGRSSGDLSSPIRKPKRLSRGAQSRPEEQEAEEPSGPEQAKTEEDAPTATSPTEAAASHHQLPPSNQTAYRVETTTSSIQESPGSVATIYMLAGTPQKPEGPVWSVICRLGNYQKDQTAPKVKSAIPKPLRRSLGRNQGSPGLSQSSGSAPGAMLSGTIESTEVRPEEASRGLGDGTESLETVQEPISGNSFLAQGSQKQAEEKEQEEPLYENVVPMSVPLQH